MSLLLESWNRLRMVSTNFDLNDAGGAWVGSIVDLASSPPCWMAHVGPRAHRRQFAAIAPTPRNTWVDSISWYGFGLFAVPQLNGIAWSHG